MASVSTVQSYANVKAQPNPVSALNRPIEDGEVDTFADAIKDGDTPKAALPASSPSSAAIATTFAGGGKSRADLVKAAKALGIPATGTRAELSAAIADALR